MDQLYNSPLVKSRDVQIGKNAWTPSSATKYLPKNGQNSLEKLAIGDLYFGQF